MSETLETRAFTVTSRTTLTDGIVEFTLSPVDDAPLTPFTPGAHVTVRTPSGAMRRYSLVNDGRAPESYVIAVKREPASRGGSTSMHDDAQEGTQLDLTAPENEFELVSAPRYLLIAGGIGITPIQAMARHLAAEGTPFELIYCTRTAAETAYLDTVTALPGNVTVHHDEGDEDNFYDFWDHFEKPTNAHVYCCGPAPLMEEIKALSGHWPEGSVHFEDFKPVDVVRADDQAFTVTLADSGRSIQVPADKTILEALREAGEKTVSSCESGTCGTCKCRLIEGEADHRDMVLMDDEKDSHIMICISRARSGDLVIEL
ncbi:MAG: oxidoreductase [Pararhodobacter sp.]|nr:oxidoreductase [Pararhodobacter sp.]